MARLKVPNTYVIIFTVILLSAISTWFVGGGEPQTWQVFSALYEGFSQQAGIIAFVLVIGGAFWVVNSTKAVDDGILKFIIHFFTFAVHELYSIVIKGIVACGDHNAAIKVFSSCYIAYAGSRCDMKKINIGT